MKKAIVIFSIIVMVFTCILLDLEVVHVQEETAYLPNKDWIVFQPLDCYATAQVFSFKGNPLTNAYRVWNKKCPPDMHIHVREAQ